MRHYQPPEKQHCSLPSETHLSYMDHADPVHKRAFYLLSRIADEFKKIVEDSTDELTFVAWQLGVKYSRGKQSD